MNFTDAPKTGFKIELPVMNSDSLLTYYDKKTNSYKPATWLEDTPLFKTPHSMAICGPCGSGKSSLMVSLINSKKKESRAYHGLFSTIILSCPKSTLDSLDNNPFEELDPSNIHHDFTYELLLEVEEIAIENAKNKMDTIFIVDDATSKLRSNMKIINKFTQLLLTLRHLKLTVWVLLQDVIQIPPSVRSNLFGVILFKNINYKRDLITRDEYLSFLSRDEQDKLARHVYQNKGDTLFINFMCIPNKFYRNFTEIIFEPLFQKRSQNVP